ncbi:MAG: DotU family type IV/VI secretion system protein [Myxococcales bacterium]|nr:DotU family type IV/VI secretion system protein [Myxococcales bacterium]
MADAYKRFIALTRPCFDAVARLHGLDALGPEEAAQVHELFLKLVDALREAATGAALERRDCDALVYAIAALMDETAITRGGALQSLFVRDPLQARHFGEVTAGEGYFQRIEALMDDSSRRGVLLVYYLGLLYGFRGRYQLRGRATELSHLIDALAERLLPPSDELPALAPDGARPESQPGGARRRFTPVHYGAAAAILAVGVYAGLRLTLRGACEAARAAYLEVDLGVGVDHDGGAS